MNKRFKDLEYTLFGADGNAYAHRGAYLIVDGGYHQLLTRECPPPVPLHYQLQWSKHLESVRNDVGCFFGTLKGRFRILKLALGFWDEVRISNMFCTCCIIHSMLRPYDGLD
ncbi:unnamed protein product, partial [Discosporangium mesarthrocarpum]